MQDSKISLCDQDAYDEDESTSIESKSSGRGSVDYKKWVKNAKHVCLVLLVGQILAGLLGASAVCAALLSRVGFSLPLIQNIPHYFMLFLVFAGVQLVQRRLWNSGGTKMTNLGMTNWRTRLWPVLCYVIAGCIDLHAFWAILAAYAYTNVTSIQLLDCLGIPTSMILSYFLLRYRYSWTHYLGAGICLFGAVLMIGADILAVTNQAADISTHGLNSTLDGIKTHVIIGDLLAVLGAILYGVSSVFQEYLTHQFGPVNYLTWFAIVSACFGAVYSAILEHSKLHELVTTRSIDGKQIPMIALAYYFGYVACMFTLDSITAFVIHRISAVFINLSLLTADLWGLLAGIWLFHVRFHYLYFASFLFILAGAFLFAIRSAKPESGDSV